MDNMFSLKLDTSFSKPLRIWCLSIAKVAPKDQSKPEAIVNVS